MTSRWELEINHGERIYIMVISKSYKSGLFFLKCWLFNIYQYTPGLTNKWRGEWTPKMTGDNALCSSPVREKD